MHTKHLKLQRGRVYDLTYRCELDRDVEAGTLRAYWTGEIDAWGKYTFVPVDGGATCYLFRREVLGFEAV